MSKSVTSQQLVDTLKALGFELNAQANAPPNAHLLLKHDKTGAILTLPQSAKPLRQIFVNTAARQVANSGIATVESFNRKLESVGRVLAKRSADNAKGVASAETPKRKIAKA